MLFILGLIVFILIIGIFGIPQRRQQYGGKVTITEVSSQNLNGMDVAGIGYPVAIENKESTIPPSIAHPIISVDLKNKSELRYPYATYGDQLGNIYVVVDVQDYAPFQTGICKIYRVDGKNLVHVKNIPDSLWCDSLVTDYKGNWLVSNIPGTGGATAEIYKIEGAAGLYVPEFNNMQLLKLFYNEDEKSMYALSETDVPCPVCLVKKYFKVTFTP